MKPIKTVIASVITTVLIMSLAVSFAYNKFAMNLLDITDIESFRNAIVAQELIKSLQGISGTNDTTNADSGATNTQDTNINTSTNQNVPDSDKPTIDITTTDSMPDGTVIYEDSYAKITYVKQESSIFGPTIKFLVESNATKNIDVSFTNVHIDGFMADLCGAYVSDLEPGKKSFETLYIYESDYEDFTSFPSMIEFIIVIRDANTWSDLAESQVIYFELQK